MRFEEDDFYVDLVFYNYRKRSGGLVGNLTYAGLAAVMGSSDCGR